MADKGKIGPFSAVSTIPHHHPTFHVRPHFFHLFMNFILSIRLDDGGVGRPRPVDWPSNNRNYWMFHRRSKEKSAPDRWCQKLPRGSPHRLDRFADAAKVPRCPEAIFSRWCEPRGGACRNFAQVSVGATVSPTEPRPWRQWRLGTPDGSRPARRRRSTPAASPTRPTCSARLPGRVRWAAPAPGRWCI